MRILILGAGGIGGIVGGRLAQNGADVTFLVREARKKNLDAKGLQIESPYGDASIPVATRLEKEITDHYDLVLLACKAYDLDSAITSIRPAMGPSSCVLPILNGMAHIKRLNEEFGAQRVLGGTIKMQATLTPDGGVRQLSDWQTLTFGEQDGHTSQRTAEFKALLDKTGIDGRLTEHVMQALWSKMVHLATAAGMTCLMRANIGEIARTPEGTALLRRFLLMNADIAGHAGYRPSDEFLEGYIKLFGQTDARYEASMLRDLERGGRIESEQILGDMLAQCRAAGLDDALHVAAYTHVKAYEQRRDAGRLPGHS
jgi:2-dehydropantoate 2-reductase